MAKLRADDIFQPGFGSDGANEIQKIANAFVALRGELTKIAQLIKSDLDLSKIADDPKELRNLLKLIQEANQIKSKSNDLLQEEQKQTKAAAEAIKKANQEQEKLTRNQKANLRLRERLKNSTSSLAKENAILNERILQQNRINKQQAREALGVEGAYQKLSKQLNEARARYKNLAASNMESTTEAKRLLIQVTALDGRLKAIDKTVGQSQRNVGNYPQIFNAARGGLVRLAGAFGLAGGAIVGFSRVVTSSFNLFSDFELTLSKVRAVSGATEGEFAQLRGQAEQLGRTTQFTASNVAELQLNLSKLGFTTNQIQDATASILDFAIATDSDLGRAAEVVASTLNAYNLEASESARVSDVAAKAFSSTALDIEKFATAIAIAGPAAEASNVSIEETTAILGKVVDAGIDASTAGTALRNIFIDIADQGITLEEALTEIAESQDKLTTANELFGKRGAIVAKVVADNVDEIDNLTDSFNNAEGAAAAAANIIGDNLAGDVKRFQSALEGAILGAGKLNDVFRNIVQGATNLINFLTGAADAEQDLALASADTARELAEEARSSQRLLDQYQELNEKGLEASKEEKEDLRRVTGLLIGRFGDSVKEIDKETGALRLNVQATKDAIIQRLLLADEQSASTLEQLKSLKAQQAIIVNNRITLKQERELFDITSRSVTTKQARNRSLNEEQRNVLRLDNALRSNTKQYIDNEIAIRELEKSLEGIFTPEQIQQLSEVKKLTEENTDTTEDAEEANEGLETSNRALAGSVGELNEQLSKLKDERDDLQASDEAAIASKNKEIDAINDQIDSLNELGRAQKEQAEERDEFAELDAKIQEDLTRSIIGQEELRNERIAELRGQGNKTAEEINAELAQIDKDFQEDVTDEQLAALEARLSNIQDAKKAAEQIEDEDERLARQEELNKKELRLQQEFNNLKEEDLKQQLDAENQAREEAAQAALEIQKKIQEQARSAVGQGVFQGFEERIRQQEDLLRQQAENAETQEERDALLRKAAEERQKAELKLAVLEAFRAELQNSGDVQAATQAGVNAAVQIKVASAIAEFREGGYTGNKGVDEVAGVVHGREFVTTAEDTQKFRPLLEGIHSGQIGTMDDLRQQFAYTPSPSQSINNFFNESPQIDYDKFGKAVAKNIPVKIEDMARDDGNRERLYRQGNRFLRQIHKQYGKPIKPSRGKRI